MSKGVSSYEDLARKCSVTRSTIYRRVSHLENSRVITHLLRVALDFEKLNRVALSIAIDIAHADEEKAIEMLKKCEDTKFIWRTYGAHNIVLITFCERGEEGIVINRIREILEPLSVRLIETCIGFTWEKIDTSPF